MSSARSENVKKDVTAIAVKYGIGVVGFLKLDDRTRVPTGENPREILPAARTMIILGKSPSTTGRISATRSPKSFWHPWR